MQSWMGSLGGRHHLWGTKGWGGRGLPFLVGGVQLWWRECLGRPPDQDHGMRDGLRALQSRVGTKTLGSTGPLLVPVPWLDELVKVSR